VPYPQFDRARLKIKPLAERKSDLTLEALMPLDAPVRFGHPALVTLGERLVAARKTGAARILMMGAHVLRSGVQRQLIDLMSRGLIDHIAMNGAAPIHDWEMALIGATTESVARYIASGEFGLWNKTGGINYVINNAARTGLGFGEAVGKAILVGDFPEKDISVLAAAAALGVPATVHVGVGCDIVHEHPNCNGAAIGETSYRDFLTFAATVERLEGGVFLNYGSAVTGPEVYLKALAMARNVAHQEGRRIVQFTTAVFDLIPLNGDFSQTPEKSDPRYYFRPWKTILSRTVADGGESFYVAGEHRDTLPALRQAALNAGG
jgi:hypothetical protein